MEDIFKCTNCNSFQCNSRNKLFQHLKRCYLQCNSSTNSLQLIDSNRNLNEILNEKLNNVHLYVCGGRLRGKTLNSCEYYNFQLKQWFDIPNLLYHRGSHASTIINNQWYVIGGGGLHSNLSNCEVYDIQLQEWKLLDVPMELSRHALCIVSDNQQYIYAIGGWYNGCKNSNLIERYDIILKQWISYGFIQQSRRLLGCTILNNKLFIFGGMISNSKPNIQSPLIKEEDFNIDEEDIESSWFTNTVEIFDLITKDITYGPNLPYSDITSAITINNIIYLFIHGKGCYTMNSCYKSFESKEISYEYIFKSTLPVENWYNFDCSSYNELIFLVGGISNGKYLRDVFCYDTISNKWIQLPSMKKQRRRCAIAIAYLPN